MNTNPKYALGVVAGKFLPPHKGHRYLVETALSKCSRVVVIVCVKPSDPIPGSIRAGWLRELMPSCEVMEIDDQYDENDSRVWAENTVRWVGRAPDAVFTSEAYGTAYASHLGCVHESVDPLRRAFPCSGTAVRSDPFSMWNFLDPPVRAWYVKRVVVLGAESTGTTTLARDLASELGTVWVSEYGREYSSSKVRLGKTSWISEEFLHIATEQCFRENAAARLANRVLVCDTDAFATRLWHRRYMGFDSPHLCFSRFPRRADLYLLTGDEIPFVQDGLRDGEHIRHEMHRWFEEELGNQPVPWHLLTGSPSSRLSQALAHMTSMGFPLSRINAGKLR